MKNWYYAINGYYRTAHISIETAPWHIFAIKKVSEFICDIIPPMPLPNIRFRLRDEFSIECNNGQKWVTVKEWYGSLDHLFHAMIHIPIFFFCHNRIETKYIEIDYEKLKELFYEEDTEIYCNRLEVPPELRTFGTKVSKIKLLDRGYNI